MRNLIWTLVFAGMTLEAQSSLKALSGQFEGLVEKTDPAVVQIIVRAFTSSEQENAPLLRSAKGNGSGVIVSPDGYIVTNSHVVANSRRIQVLLPQTVAPGQRIRSVLRANGKLVNATLVGQDRETDIAVLKIEDEKKLPFLEFGDSEMLREGQLVFAFGSPLGLDNSVTMGIVSATARQVKPEDPMIYVQTDAAINPGNSGGPLVDTEGRLVGINTFILSNSGGSDGIGFAAPSNIVKTVYEQIRESGRVRRGQVGLLAQTINPFLAAALKLDRDGGVLIEDVSPGSPAEAAGLKIGDVLLSVNGKPLENARQFGVNVYQNAGKTVELGILRGKKEMTLGVAVLERRRDPDRLLAHLQGESSRVRKLGILAVELDEKVLPLYPELRVYTGVAIAGITADLSMESNSLKPGDVIHRVNQDDVLNLKGLKALLEEHKHGEVVAVQVERGGQMQFVLVEID
jgi:serine protease Do